MAILIGENGLTLENFRRIVLLKEPVELAPAVLQKVQFSFEFLSKFNKGKVIYGINTGFGPMAPYRINQRHQKELQYNLIRSHACGGGPALSPAECRAVILVRLQSLCRGLSGIHPSALELLKEFLNRDILPLIYEMGGVGASGDLVQLAHLALGMIGEGRCYYKRQVRAIQEALDAEGLQPMEVHIREGLSIMNGTAVMTGLGLLNILHLYNQLHISLLASCLLNEVVRSYTDQFSEELSATKPHQGQRDVARFMCKFLRDSRLTRLRPLHLYEKETHGSILKDKVQEYYSLRCVPQILGPIWDAARQAEQILLNEACSVNDNPVVIPQAQNVLHGGNFHGDYVAYEMDKLRIGLTKLGLLAERQLNFLMNPKLNGQFPPFANRGRPGLNFGLQGIQFTAVSAAAENQTLSNPVSVHSIPNNNDNQDIVSMGTNAALLTRKVIDNNYRILAVLLLALVQVCQTPEFLENCASSSRYWLQYLEQKGFRPFADDQARHDLLQALENELKEEVLRLQFWSKFDI
ncbi:MAG: aromatic amino acid ammonia-lyase [Flavobacteriales bacterium]|nr:aromatic amino acid ammonia-lyase [Flavobacteriales bacterium]MCX7768676.1 aromatic amino acid ammonia-lyase [Flavobacteriales bacterium]MDW8410694.1 aromatic amino acid ammonia-lyase [Flavobacteriales bacterium]